MENSLLGGIVRKIILIINEPNHDYYYPLEKKEMTIIINNNINNDVSSSITFCHYNTNYLFYANYLTAAVKKIKTGIKYSDYREKEESVHHVELAEIHSILKIAITPLTANNDRYLCIYLESSSPNQEIIAKIGNTI